MHLSVRQEIWQSNTINLEIKICWAKHLQFQP